MSLSYVLAKESPLLGASSLRTPGPHICCDRDPGLWTWANSR